MAANMGLFIESEIVMAINKKKVYELPQNLKFALFKMFGALEENEIVYSGKIEGFMKPDIYVEYKGVRKNVSVKSGRATEVHAEYINTFVHFLKECGLSDKSCDFVKRYCYGDGTDDGTGEEAMDYITLKTHFKDDIDAFNEEVIENPALIQKVIDRCIFLGNHEEYLPADYIYFGDHQYGNLCSKKQIFKHLKRRNWDFMCNPHIGPLQFRAHIRGKSRYPENEYKRHTIDIWWANLSSDMNYISERYDI